MAFDFQNPWKGGALGKLGDAILAIQTAMENVKGEARIIVERMADNSFIVKYGGPVARNGWDGKMYKTGSSTPIMNVDVTDPANLLDEYVCVNTETWSTEWASAPKTEDNWHSYRVCESWGMAVDEGQFGSFYLSPAFNGSIVVGKGGFDRPLVENNILSAEIDPESEDENLKWTEGPLAIEANAEGETTGFAFTKPDPEDIDAHLQMKTNGAFVSEEKQVGLLATSTTSAAWGVIETDPWPENSKLEVVTGIDDEIEITPSGNTLTIRLKVYKKEIDFNEHTIGEQTEAYAQGTVSGVTC